MKIIPCKRNDLPNELLAIPFIAPLLVVSDVNTCASYGYNVTLPFPYTHHHCYATPPHADKETADLLATYAADYGSILAIGSGTLNDLCKYAAYQADIPYAVLATAPSMNGYASPNASLILHGHKQSVNARAPIAIIYDQEVLVNAPPRLIASGVGDTLCRTTVMRDAWLSHVMCSTPWYGDAFADMGVLEEKLLNAIHEGERAVMVDALMASLLRAGQAMGDGGSSAPASQGEHMIAHVLEMIDPTLTNRHFHGEIIAVTTLTMARIQETCMSRPFVYKEDNNRFPYYETADVLGGDTAYAWQKTYTQKCESVVTFKYKNMPTSSSLSSVQLERVLKLSGCPTSPADLGVSDKYYAQALRFAPFSRNRFTWLDAL